MLASTKLPFEHVVYYSGVESQLTRNFERKKNVKVYAKLPSWFKIDTPLGTYNPDWAVLITTGDEDKLFFVIETKGSMGLEFLRPSEIGKIEGGKRHFEELSKATGSKISLEYVSDMEELMTRAMLY